MCLKREHVAFLEAANERHYAEARIGYETYIRFEDQATRCRACELCENGRQGDMLEACRVSFLRFFISMKRDAEKRRKGLPPAGALAQLPTPKP